MEDAPTIGSAARRAAHPFRFKTCLILPEATGLRAATLPQLVKLMRDVPDGCIYHHTHYFVLSHHYLTPEPPNDFAYWVGEVLGEEALGERLAGVDVMQYGSLAELREALAKTIEDYLDRHPLARFKFATEGEEFFFVKSIRVVLPTQYTAVTLAEFAEALQQISLHALYFHIFGAKLREQPVANDFSRWLDRELGEAALSREIGALDPYAHTLEALRSLLLSLIHQRLGGEPVADVPAD
jgi:hypothetical protein